MKIVITGGLGYVGSALCELYADRSEHEIVVVDRQFIPERVATLPEHIRYVQADVQDTDTMTNLLKRTDILHVLSAEVEAESSIHREQSVWAANFDAPQSLIQACPPNTRVIFPSTGNVFGGVDESQKYMDLTEEDEPRPKYPYAETKVAMEQFLADTDRDYTILRFGTNHGYSKGIRFNLVTNIFVRKAMLGENLVVHGTGENYRPTACVKDCARALEFVSTRSDASQNIYHIVCQNFRIRELAETVVSFFDTGSEVEYIAREVPFSAYALNSDRIRNMGFEFAWDMESSILDMQRVFKPMIVERPR